MAVMIYITVMVAMWGGVTALVAIRDVALGGG
jgi:hypothetical protein